MSDGTNEALSNSDELDSGTSSDQASDHESSDNDDGPADSVENEQDEIDYSQHPLHKLLHKMAKDKPQISQDDLDELGTLLGQEDTQVDLPNSNNETALHVAAEAGLVEAARMLIDAGASLTERDDDKRQPLHLACREGHTEMARLLLEKGADIEAVQYQQATALDDAAHWDHLEVVEMLLDWGANSQVVCHDDCSLLHRATYQGHDKIVRALLQDSKANLDAPEGVDGLTALHYAIWNENMEILSILLDNGARLDVQDKDGWTPLMTATRRFPECIPILLGQKEFNGQLEIPDNESYTPLLEASKNAELETVRLLINAGADCNARDKCGRTALHLAIKRGLPSIVSVLLEDSKVNINAQSNDLKNTPLHLASGVRPISENETDPVSVPDELIIYEYEYEEGQYGTIVQYLLERKADPRATNKNGETALHYAAASGDPSRLESIMNVLNKEDMTTQNGKGWTALHSALKGKDPIAALSSLLHSGKFDTADFGDDNQMWEEAVKWASGDFRSHDVARLLLKYRPEVPRSLLSNNWSAIEWAAHDQMPEVLGRLVDTSRNNDETDKALESALTLMLTSISISSRNTVNERSAMVLSLLMSNSPRPNEERLQSALASVLGLIERPDDEKICEQLPRLLWLLITANHRGPDMDDRLEKTLKVVRSHKVPTKRDGPEISQAKPRVIPPQPRTKKGSNKDQWRKQVMEKDKQQPEIKPDDRKGFRMEDLEAIEVILQDPPFAQVFEDSKRYELPKLNEGLSDKLSGFMADIVQFYKSQGKSGTIRRKRPVQEVIYDAGPKRIMATTIRSLYGIIGKDSGLPGHTMDTEAGPHFTWVHLPSTNMDWMNDLLMRIMKDEQHDVWQFRDARSFFQDSWAEVPDESTQSRIMRPRTVTKGLAMDIEEPGRTRPRDMIEKTSAVAKGKQKKDAKEKEGTKIVKRSHKRKSKVPAVSATYIPYFCFSTNYRTTTNPSANQTKYERLLEAYSSSGNHRSPTLDEWYYHFGKGEKSQEDKNHRNETQVVTKFANIDDESTEGQGNTKAEGAKPDKWTVLRVNQLWIWTLADKWLITATSCLLDDSHDTLAEEILRHLSKEADLGSSGSQSASVSEMVETIVDYCVRMYERDPKVSGQSSIGQTYSHYMNKLSRDETALFDEFRRQSEGYQHIETPKGSSRDSNQASSGLIRDDEIRTALRQAETLYSEIKDFRDEVNILSSAAHYQLAVQKRLPGNKVKTADLSASYVLEDLEKMDRVANRIELAVNATLSLQQSEISSRQATLATRQALQSTEQGKILMAFTFATLLFLPLSFLSSLFALDVSSFQQTPAWAFVVLFLVAVAVTVVVSVVAAKWNKAFPIIKARIPRLNKESSKPKSDSPEGDRVQKAAKLNSSGNNAASPHVEPHYWFRSRRRRKQQTNEC